MKRSRLSRRIEKQTRKNLFLGLLGIIIIFAALIKFGIPLLVNFSLFVSQFSSSKQQEPKKGQTIFVAPPIIYPQPNATNSANITISGTSIPGQTIEIFINDTLVGKTEAIGDGSFSINKALTPGVNTLKAKAITPNGGESNFSNSQTIIYKSAAPSLNVSSPLDGQSFSKDQNPIPIKGSTDTDVKITVNDFWAILDEKNNFSYNLLLQAGENQIKIVATDQAGNKTERNLKVTYSAQ